MLGNVLQGKRARYLLALDTAQAQQLQWLNDTKSTFSEYAIPFEDLSTTGTNQTRIREIVARMLATPGPLAIIVPLTPKEEGKPRAGSEISDRIVNEFTARTGRHISWTTKGEWKPGQPVERGNTEMAPPNG